MASFGEGFSGVEADSDRHRVDEQADYRFHAGHLWWAS